MKKIRNEKGITLIALVVTIIVLLILASVVIATLIGNNGIITNALKAKEGNDIAGVREELELVIAEMNVDRLTSGSVLGIKDYVFSIEADAEKGINSKLESVATLNADETITYKGYVFEINENGKIINHNVVNNEEGGGSQTPQSTGSATFGMEFNCINGEHCEYDNHEDECWQPCTPVTLTWEELQLEENGTRFGYNASTISNDSIGEWTFSTCKTLTSIIVPDSVSLSNFALCSARNLTSVVLPNGMTAVGDGQFWDCRSLTSITIPDSVTTISNSAFMHCESLSDFIIKDNITYIDDYAFSYCETLAKITIPYSVTNIGECAFELCDNLTEIIYIGTIEQWNAIPKGANWNSEVQTSCIVHCTDGDITI